MSPRWGLFFMGLLTCAALLAGCAGQDEQPTEGYLEVAPGVEIYFERVGDGPQVVVIPGGMYLREEFAVLAAPTRTLFFLDQRGRGRSSHIADASQLGMEQEVTDLETVRAHSLIYGLMGAIGGAVMAVIYNVVAGLFGGLELDLQ